MCGWASWSARRASELRASVTLVVGVRSGWLSWPRAARPRLSMIMYQSCHTRCLNLIYTESAREDHKGEGWQCSNTKGGDETSKETSQSRWSPLRQAAPHVQALRSGLCVCTCRAQRGSRQEGTAPVCRWARSTRCPSISSSGLLSQGSMAFRQTLQYQNASDRSSGIDFKVDVKGPAPPLDPKPEHPL